MGEVDTSKGAVRAQRSIARHLFPHLGAILKGERGMGDVEQISRLNSAIGLVDPETGKDALVKEFAAKIQQLYTDGGKARTALEKAIEIVKARQAPSPDVNHAPESPVSEIEEMLQGVAAQSAPVDLLAEFGEENKAAQIGSYLQGFGWKAEVEKMGKRGSKYRVVGTRPGLDENVRVELEYDGATCAGGSKTDVQGKTLRIKSASALKKFVELGV